MDSSPVLRPQNHNKIRTDFVGMKKENNKRPGEPKPFKLASAPHKNAENQDPRSSETGRKAPVRAGVSRLPVLAKGIHLQTTSADFSQSHSRWEEKPLTGKAKKKKPCTRPVPFNLSQPKSSVTSTDAPQPLNVLQGRTCPVRSENTGHLKIQTNNAKLTKRPVMLKSNEDSNKETGRSHGTTKDKTSHLSGHTLKTSAPSTDCAEACLDDMNLLTLKDPSKTSCISQNAQSNFSKASSADKFTPNHAALLSFLRNEGETTRGLNSATPQSKLYITCPQRVSVTKSHQKAAPTTGSLKQVQFSPDAAALRSILENEGIKAAGPVGAAARSSACPSGRGTSIYTAQRVPVRKTQTETTGGPLLTLKDTPQNKWTPQRVRNTRHQPMSSMKWHTSTQQSPYISTPGLRPCNTKQPQQEEVVQRLFNDPDDEQSTSKDSDSQAQQLPAKAPTIKSRCEENDKMSATSTDEDEEKEQPFLQTVQRESVIFFSTGKKLVRAPLFERQETSVHQKQHNVAPSEHREELKVHEGMSEPICQSQPPIPSLHKDTTLQKPHAINPALALLRKRLPPLDELRLDEEVAIYTAASGPAPSGFLPPRPRCGNPLASILHFEESTRFVPISFDCLLGPSPLQER